jgi:hypothetical protein
MLAQCLEKALITLDLMYTSELGTHDLMVIRQQLYFYARAPVHHESRKICEFYSSCQNNVG